MLKLFYEAIQETLDQLSGCKKRIVEMAMEAKLHLITTKGQVEHPIYDALVFREIRDIFGGRLRFILTASELCDPNIANFFKIVLGALVVEGYGISEATFTGFKGHSKDPVMGHFGPTVPPLFTQSNVEFKLVDLPEFGYTHRDLDAEGRPCPRGELHLRGPAVFMGYYKDPERTSEVVDKEGWLRTGDVCMLLPDNGALKFIDRKCNFQRLVAPTGPAYLPLHLHELVYAHSTPLLKDIFLHCNESFIVAVAVADASFVAQMAKTLHVEGDYSVISKDFFVRQQYLNVINECARREGVSDAHLASNIYIEPEGFEAKKLFTEILQLKRDKAAEAYKLEIKEMYKEGRIVEKDRIHVCDVE